MAWMLKNTNALVGTVTAGSLQEDDTLVTSELGFEILCSYNWLKDGSAIFVPGGPPRWNPMDLPVTLPRDTGYQFVDQNAFRVPKYPFEPAFRALAYMNGSLKLDDTDLVVNRNSLRKLLDFAAVRRQDPFRIDLHMVKDTLFVSRREKTARQMLHGAADSGYGHNFETAFTKARTGLDGSSSHHQIVRYKLGSLDCVVRFEADACYEQGAAECLASGPGQEVEDLEAALAGISVHESPPDSKIGGKTKVIARGSLVVSTSLAELKAHKTAKISKAMPQLWFGRTPYLITGMHVEGTFHSISCEHIGAKFEAWETANQQTLRKLVNLLKTLKNIVGPMPGRTAIVICQSKGAPLEVFSENRTSRILPSDVIDQHWSQLLESES